MNSNRIVPRLASAALLLAMASAPMAEVELQPDRWTLMSLPADASTETVGSLFGDDLPFIDYQQSWTIIRYSSASGYDDEVDWTDSLRPGEGFWMIQRGNNPVTVDLPAGLNPPSAGNTSGCAVSSGCLSINLPRATSGNSWSLIGSPSALPINVSDIRIVAPTGTCSAGCTLAAARSAGLTDDKLLQYNGSGPYQTLQSGDVLAPWRGAWFPTAAGTGGDLTLLMPLRAGGQADVFARNRALGRGINLGNALEAPNEGDWGMTLQADYFDTIASAGFDSVRVPIRWSAHAAQSAPYRIDPAFFARIDWVLDQAERVGLTAIINMHHFDAFTDNPSSQRARFSGLWDQIASRYAGRPDTVYFELLNEPHSAFNDNPALWNTIFAEALAVVRRSNPERTVLAGPVGWNSIDELDALQLPADDQLIVSVHVYDPFPFTHQGATWVSPVPPVGTTWNASSMQLGAGFQDWSWDTSVTPVAGSLQIAYSRQYAGFNLRTPAPMRPTSLSVEVIGSVDVSVACQQGDDFTEVDRIAHQGTTWTSYTADLSACGGGIRNVVLQNVASGAATFGIRDGELCEGGNCLTIVSSAGQALDERVAQAADWAAANNRPLHIGEFGAHEPGDMASRAAWTRQVQDSAQGRNASTAYWEFGASFGAYDRTNSRWRTPLLDALLGN